MVEEIQKYYENITRGIGPNDVAKWEAAIRAAEARRLSDPAAMDILATKKLDGIVTSRTMESPSTPGNDWCLLALRVEEQQSVFNQLLLTFIERTLELIFRTGSGDWLMTRVEVRCCETNRKNTTQKKERVFYF